MKRLIGIIGDKLQAAFPPNRVAILLAAPITAAAAWISGAIASNIPGVSLPTGVIAGVMFAGVVIVIRLLDRWFDQWQKGEPIAVDSDLEAALGDLEHSPEVDALIQAMGILGELEEGLSSLQAHFEDGSIEAPDVVKELEAMTGKVAEFVHGPPAAEPAPAPTPAPAE